MKKKAVLIAGLLLGSIVIAIIAISIVVKVYVFRDKAAASISIIGGADGPTSIFIAGKLSEGEKEVTAYTAITMKEAEEIFKTQGDYVILDVRRAEEFAEGHIPGAINIANEDITDTEPIELTDKAQTIYVYCRSGNRSRQAAAKLVAMGYQNIIECGGILDWTGELER